MMFTYEHALSTLIYCHAFLVFTAIPVWGYWTIHRSIMQHRELNADTYRRELEAETAEIIANSSDPKANYYRTNLNNCYTLSY